MTLRRRESKREPRAPLYGAAGRARGLESDSQPARLLGGAAGAGTLRLRIAGGGLAAARSAAATALAAGREYEARRHAHHRHCGQNFAKIGLLHRALHDGRLPMTPCGKTPRGGCPVSRPNRRSAPATSALAHAGLLPARARRKWISADRIPSLICRFSPFDTPHQKYSNRQKPIQGISRRAAAWEKECRCGRMPT